MARIGKIERKTTETQISVTWNLDQYAKSKIDTGIPFLDHMLETLGKHSGTDLTVSAKGDLQIDPHHTSEDIGICIGLALEKALGEKKGINRFGFASILVLVALFDPALFFFLPHFLDLWAVIQIELSVNDFPCFRVTVCRVAF